MRPAVRRSTFTALRHPNYRRFAAASGISGFSVWVQRVAQDWMVLQLSDGNGFLLGLTTALQFLPALLLGPFAGLLADRAMKQQLLQRTQLGMACTAACLGTLGVAGLAGVGHVYLLALVFGVFSAFDAPARQALVSEVVSRKDLTNAVGLNSAILNASRVIGPAVAGLLIAALGSGAEAAAWVMLANTGCYVAVATMLGRLDGATMTISTPIGRQRGQLVEGLRYVRGRPQLMMVMTCVLFAGVFGLNFQLTSALMTTDEYGLGPGEFGLLGTMMAIGSLVGSLAAARRASAGPGLVAWSAVAFGACVVVAGLMPTYQTFALWAPVTGFCALTMITAANTTVQLAATPSVRGRVMSLHLMVLLGGTPVGGPLLGWIGEALGPRWTLYIGGLGTIVGAALAAALFARPQRGDPTGGRNRTSRQTLTGCGALVLTGLGAAAACRTDDLVVGAHRGVPAVGELPPVGGRAEGVLVAAHGVDDRAWLRTVDHEELRVRRGGAVGADSDRQGGVQVTDAATGAGPTCVAHLLAISEDGFPADEPRPDVASDRTSVDPLPNRVVSERGAVHLEVRFVVCHQVDARHRVADVELVSRALQGGHHLLPPHGVLTGIVDLAHCRPPENLSFMVSYAHTSASRTGVR